MVEEARVLGVHRPAHALLMIAEQTCRALAMAAIVAMAWPQDAEGHGSARSLIGVSAVVIYGISRILARRHGRAPWWVAGLNVAGYMVCSYLLIHAANMRLR